MMLKENKLHQDCMTVDFFYKKNSAVRELFRPKISLQIVSLRLTVAQSRNF